MAANVGFDGSPAQTVPGLNQLLRDVRKIGPDFRKGLRQANIEVAKHVVTRSVAAASTSAERSVARGLRARPDAIPKIDVSTSRMYTSKARPNPRRSEKARAKIIDVWFGTEFGGGKHGAGNKTHRLTHKGRLQRTGGGYTTQFRPHRGTQGYFFYPTVRQEGPTIVKQYAEAVDDVRRRWERGRL